MMPTEKPDKEGNVAPLFLDFAFCIFPLTSWQCPLTKNPSHSLFQGRV